MSGGNKKQQNRVFVIGVGSKFVFIFFNFSEIAIHKDILGLVNGHT
jgi:hypothetical protein